MADSETRYLYVLVILVLIGTVSSAILLATGQTLEVVSAINVPIVGMALTVVVAKLSGIEKKVNGQLRDTTNAAYNVGYVHGQQGVPPLAEPVAVVEVPKQ